MGTDKRVTYLLAGTAAVGASALAYYFYTKENKDAMDAIQQDVNLDEIHVTWLEGIAVKYTNGDKVEALHKMLNNCITLSVDSDRDEAIFQKIRCKTCGQKNKVSFRTNLTPDQVAFISASAEKHDITGGKDKALRIMFEYSMNDADEGVMFG